MAAQKDILIPIAIVGLTLVLSLIHIFPCSKRFFSERITPRLKGPNERTKQALSVFYKRIGSFVLFWLFPFLFIKFVLGDSPKNYGLSKGNGHVPPTVILPFLVITVLTLLFFARKERVNENYPEVGLARYSKMYFTLNAFTYIIYFFGYESLYRGFLLFGLRKYTGNWVAVVASMTFATFTHIRASKHLLLGSVAIGFMFPYIALMSESFRIVFVLHSLIGIGMDVLCIRARSRMDYEGSHIVRDRAQ